MANENKNKEGNSIFIRDKPFLNYVTAVVMQFTRGTGGTGGVGEIVVKARGKFISKAVDVVEVARNRFMEGVVIKNIVIDSEEFKNKEDRQVRVSSIEITLAKN